MAKVTQPLGSGEARGSVGGFTYNTWRGIRTVKTRSGPKAEPSQLMLDMLALGQEANSIWQSIDQTTRNQWNAWAADQRESYWTGQDKRLTGHNWFVRIYVRRALLGDKSTPPIPDYVITRSLVDLALTWTPPNLYLTWDSTPFDDYLDYFIEIYRTHALSAGRNATIHDAFLVEYIPAFDESPQIYTPGPGTYTYFCRLIHTSGLVTPWQSARITIPP